MLDEVPVTITRANDRLVQVHAASINPLDVKLISGNAVANIATGSGACESVWCRAIQVGRQSDPARLGLTGRLLDTGARRVIIDSTVPLARAKAQGRVWPAVLQAALARRYFPVQRDFKVLMPCPAGLLRNNEFAIGGSHIDWHRTVQGNGDPWETPR